MAAPDPEADNLRRCWGALHGRACFAEDEPVNPEIARELLGELGLSVDVANNGAEAVAMAHRGGYALILMDIQMPHTDGLAATREIRARHPCRDVPIIAMTANAFGGSPALHRGRMNDFSPSPSNWRCSTPP